MYQLTRHRLPLVVLLPLFAACGTANDPILVGVVGGFAGRGDAAMQHGAELAAAEINDGRGVRGRRIELLVRDDSGDAGRALRIAREFAGNPAIVAVIGDFDSDPTRATLPIYNDHKRPVVTISPSAADPAVAGAGRYTFSIAPNALVRATALADWTRNQLGRRTAAILFANTPIGRDARTAFRNEFTARGGRIVSEDPYSSELPSFEPYLARIRRRGGTGILLITGTGSALPAISQALDTVGSNPVILATDDEVSLDFEVDASRRIYMALPYLADRQHQLNESFVAAYRRTFGNQTPDHKGAGAYDIVSLIARAVAAVGSDRALIREYLALLGTDSPKYDGVTGAIGFDRNGQATDREVIIGLVSNGEIVMVSSQ